MDDDIVMVYMYNVIRLPPPPPPPHHHHPVRYFLREHDGIHVCDSNVIRPSPPTPPPHNHFLREHIIMKTNCIFENTPGGHIGCRVQNEGGIRINPLHPVAAK